MADVDLAYRRLALRHEHRIATAPVPRVRRGAQRSREEAITHHQDTSSECSAVFEENAPEIEFGTPRHRKDLTKLGLPYTNEPMIATQRNFHSMTLDGIDETIVDMSTRITDDRYTVIRQTPYIASPLRQAHVLSPSSDGHCSDDIASDPTEASRNSLGRTCMGTQSTDPYNTAAMRIRSSQDLFASAADALGHMQFPQSSQYLRPPATRLPSLSSPNLTARTVSSGVIHSRNASTTAPTPSDISAPADLTGYLAPRASSASYEQPILELMRHYVSPLEDLRERFECLSEAGSSRSSSSFYTAHSSSKRQSQIRFPSFDSPQKHDTPTTVATQHHATPTVSSGSSAFPDSDAMLARGVEGSPSPVRMRPVTLPPPREAASPVDHREPTRFPAAPSTVHRRPRQDSGISVVSIKSETSEILNADRRQDIPFGRDIPLALDGVFSPVITTSSSGTKRSFPVFSPGLDGAYDYSRYPDPRRVLNRRSMPTSPYLVTSEPEQSQPSRRPERPYSHGARPRGNTQPSIHPEHTSAMRSPPSRITFEDRLPPRPTALLSPSVRSPVARRPNQENDGSAEEELMRREMAQMQLRGRTDVQRRSDENAPATTNATAVLDTTPPREGRFERLMRI